MKHTGTVRRAERGEEGYLLLGLVVMVFLLLLVMAVAAPRVAKQLKRDREVESEHRALQYVRAIQLFYGRNHRYPNSVDELLGKQQGGMSFGGSNLTQRFLRQEYKDPLTGGEYRLIHYGEAKTEVKGFFGEPLQGMAAGNMGSVSGMISNFGSSMTGATNGMNPGSSGSFGSPATGGLGSSTGGFGATSGSGFGSSMNSSPTGGTMQSPTGGTDSSQGSSQTGSGTGMAGSTDSGNGSGSGSTSGSSGSGTNSTSATSFQGSKGAIIGVGSNAKGHGLVEWNGSENIEDWEFLYDPRVELLKAKVSLLGGSPAASGSLGSGFNSGTGLGTGMQMNSPNGTNNSGFGSGFGSNNSGFGNSSSGSGSSGSNSGSSDSSGNNSGSDGSGSKSGSSGNSPNQ